MNSPTNEPPSNPQTTPIQPGTEIESEHFKTSLESFDSDDPRIRSLLSLKSSESNITLLHGIDSSWLPELVDALEMIQRQVRRHGPNGQYQALGSCLGVRMGQHYDEITEDATDGLRLVTERSGYWCPSETRIDPSMLNELHQHLEEVLECLQTRALPNETGYGFRFAST